ncbi:hypothetical protein MGG_17894 [Pyricularia oryzae 70-15]|uniref:Uncharacterized protein n=1 Tax=Pyricularia oryzae (strain 70-15 / ATCC MYA-4617 / FGSC 8958) TaxID=242507 RepID=G4NL21_PYRO7|nr:uncharacterized protein MGG_17894 [Pyricularia oryzae 70-15]EHA45954.1 hypothetical protein MGG_17894 [Pyricularia oryzae 70-15]KAI7918243.1 hypothetical protein M9X92_006984 [Pyricularia oryzae]KAI7919011.1 hypothetical protein M0657_007304 [Pyricularia oryzae]
MQFPSALIFGLLLQSALAEPKQNTGRPGECPPGQIPRVNGECPTGSFGASGGTCPAGTVPPTDGICPDGHQPCNLEGGHLSKRYEGMDQSLVRRDGGIIATVGCLVVSTLCCLLCCCGRPRGGHSNDGSHGRSYRAGYRSGYTDGCFTSEIASDCM